MLSSTTTSPAPPLSSPSPPYHRHLLLLRQPPCLSSAVLSLSAGQSSPLLLPITVRISVRRKCFAKSSTSEDQLSHSKISAAEAYDDDSVEEEDRDIEVPSRDSTRSTPTRSVSSSADLLSLGIPEPVFEVVEVKSTGLVSIRKIDRRSLLKTSGLRPRDIRSIDPSLWLTNSMPSLLVRDHAILLNMGSLRAIVKQEHVLIFNYNRNGGKAFIESLLPRLNPRNTTGGPCMPFVLELQDLLEVLPKRLPADALEQLRTSKQTLVELGSRAGALRQMLLDLLEDTMEIRRICFMGRNCTINSLKHSPEPSLSSDNQIAEEEEEEIEMLLENYLQRCESCHGQAEKLLDSAKEMEDSIAVNLSSRRLEVSKVELLLQVGAFCLAIGALVTGIFGMNLKCHIEEHTLAFCLTTVGILVAVVVGFVLMYQYLRKLRVL